MIRSSPVLRDISVAAATAVLVLLVGLSAAAAPAQADDGEREKVPCVVLCGPDDTPTTPQPEEPTGLPSSSAPMIESPAPAPAVPVAPAPVPTLAPEPIVSPAEETPSAAPITTVPSASSPATASTESNWDKPIAKTAKPTQAAAVSRNDGSGLFGGPGLLAIMGGVLLLGVAGLAFAWWSRNRLASH